MSSLPEHCHGEKTHFSRNKKRTVFVKPNEQSRACSDIVMARKRTFRGTRKEQFSLSPMNKVELVQTLSWRENALFEERKRTVFVKPNEQCGACSNIVMARKRTFRGTKKNSL